MQDSPPQPWYKEPWPWILISITGLGVVAGTTLAIIGISSPPEIVRGDYQPLAKMLIDTHERTGQAEALGLSGRLDLSTEDITLRLTASAPDALPAQLMIQFRHPASSAGDSVAVLERWSTGEYRGRLTSAPHPRAHVVVSDLTQTWWLYGRLEEGSTEPVAIEARRL